MIQSSEPVLRTLDRQEPLCGLQIVNAQGELEHSDQGGRALRGLLADDRALLEEVRRVASQRQPGEAQLALPTRQDRWLQLNLSRLSDRGTSVAVTFALVPKAPSAAPGPEGAARLSRRERQVAELAARGLANIEIARELQASPNTIKQHLANAYRKTGAAGRDELAALLE